MNDPALSVNGDQKESAHPATGITVDIQETENKKKGGRNKQFTEEERKIRNRMAQAVHRRKRNSYVQGLEETLSDSLQLIQDYKPLATQLMDRLECRGKQLHQVYHAMTRTSQLLSLLLTNSSSSSSSLSNNELVYTFISSHSNAESVSEYVGFNSMDEESLGKMIKEADQTFKQDVDLIKMARQTFSASPDTSILDAYSFRHSKLKRTDGDRGTESNQLTHQSDSCSSLVTSEIPEDTTFYKRPPVNHITSEISEDASYQRPPVNLALVSTQPSSLHGQKDHVKIPVANVFPMDMPMPVESTSQRSSSMQPLDNYLVQTQLAHPIPAIPHSSSFHTSSTLWSPLVPTHFPSTLKRPDTLSALLPSPINTPVSSMFSTHGSIAASASSPIHPISLHSTHLVGFSDFNDNHVSGTTPSVRCPSSSLFAATQTTMPASSIHHPFNYDPQ